LFSFPRAGEDVDKYLVDIELSPRRCGVYLSAMRIRLGELRRVVREVLQEDRESFLTTSEPIVKGKGPSAPRDIKRLWNTEADHGFFTGLTKVHWVRRYQDLRFFDKGGSRDEVSVGLYLTGKKVSPASAWMEPGVGVVLQGRVTLASNDMGSIWTGYADEAQPQHTKTSGAVRRGTMMNMSALEDYIIDAASFKEAGSMGNEGVLDNWRPVAIVLTDVGAFNPDVLRYVKDLVTDGLAFKGISVVDQNMKPLDLDALLEELYRED